MSNPKVTISGFDIEWDLERGLNLWAGVPTLSMFIPGTAAGLMSGMAAMVGVERFNLCLQIGGQQSIDNDWPIVSAAPTFEEGIRHLSEIAWPAGWGRWEVVSLDRERKEARYRVRHSWEAIYQRSLGVRWGSAMTAGKLAALTERLLGVPCWAEQTAFEAAGAEHDEFVVRPTDRTAEQRLNDLLEAGQATSADLAVALQKIKQEVAERERTERDLRQKLELIERQEAALRALAAPIIRVWEGVLTVPVMGGLNRDRAASLMEALLHAIAGSQTSHVILDLTAVESVDTSTADHLIRIVRAVELLGARVVITGIQPAVAQIVVSLGVDLGQVTTLRDLQEGLKACMGAARRGA
jgi:rsbT co-antagonist protein RsbR